MPEMSPAILIVDDEPDVRKVVRTLLEADGYQVAEAADGPAALQLMNSIGGPRGPQLVVLDVMMPGIDGIEVCRRIDHQAMKVIMLSARDDAESRTRAEAAGADGYLTKPFSAIDLLDELESLSR